VSVTPDTPRRTGSVGLYHPPPILHGELQKSALISDHLRALNDICETSLMMLHGSITGHSATVRIARPRAPHAALAEGKGKF